jgi:PAS domain S-box-containing protein
MMPHGQRSIRRQLMTIVLVTTASALLVSGFALLIFDLNVYRQSWTADLSSEADILALSTAPALAFDDRAAAQRNLFALKVRPAVLAAAVYTNSGALYARFLRAGSVEPPSKLVGGTPSIHFEGQDVEVTRTINRNGEFLGTIYLRAQYQVRNRVVAFLSIFSLVMLASLAVALVLSAALHREITGPLDAIVEIADRVVAKRDYSVRVAGKARHEMGVVVTAFNSMLDEVQTRTDALELANQTLKLEVEERLSAESALRESEKLYRAIGESMNYGVWVCAADGRNIYTSESFLHLTGLTQQQCGDFGWGSALHPDDRRGTLESWSECVATGSFWYREHRILGIDGAHHPILAQGVPMRNDEGKVTGWAGINLDIGRLKQTEAALREADRRKDEFLATLAHELRNPLAPIRHAVKLLGSPASDESKRRWGRDVIGRQVERMSLLLDDLLDVSRITRGRLELKKENTALEAVVGAAIETARPLIDEKGHTLSVRLPPEPVTLFIDPLRISQALSNLLTNAAKYSDTNGRIDLVVESSAENFVMRVADTGIGFEPGTESKLFEMFSQVESAMKHAEGGLGIGLALVKGLVGLHGGSVEGRSEGHAKGSEFVIRLPTSAVVMPAPVGTAALLDYGSSSKSMSGRKLLVADDNRDAADSLAMVLELLGYQVMVAHSGNDAIETAKRQRPDAVILDIGMPDMSGYDVARTIRRQTWGEGILLLAMTGWGQADDIDRAQAAGFDKHLTKPADPDEVHRLLFAYFEQLAAS